MNKSEDGKFLRNDKKLLETTVGNIVKHTNDMMKKIAEKNSIAICRDNNNKIIMQRKKY